MNGCTLRSVAILALAALSLCAASVGMAQAGGKHQKRVVRTGRIIDTDTTYGDNQFHVAYGHVSCKHGEEVINGGLQIVKVDGLFNGPARTGGGEDAPDLKHHGWKVAFESDLGGLARDDFRVVVDCRER